MDCTFVNHYNKPSLKPSGKTSMIALTRHLCIDTLGAGYFHRKERTNADKLLCHLLDTTR